MCRLLPSCNPANQPRKHQPEMPAIKTEPTPAPDTAPYATPTKPKKRGPPMSEEVKQKLKDLRATRKANGQPTRIKRKKSVSFKKDLVEGPTIPAI